MPSIDFSQKPRIRLIGSRKDIEAASAVLSHLTLTGNEGKDRLIIQPVIDSMKLKASILYEGNSVYGANRFLPEFKRLYKSGKMDKMSRDFYTDFLMGICADIAHYDIGGYVAHYDNDFYRVCREVVATRSLPGWATDQQVALDACKAVMK